LIKFLLVASVATMLLGCTSNQEASAPEFTNPKFHIGTTEGEVPLIAEDCWDWYPVGDGVVWVLSSDQGEELVATFPIEKIEGDRALITDLGWIFVGQFVLAEDDQGALTPIFRVQEIDPEKGVLVAVTGDIEGSCGFENHSGGALFDPMLHLQP